MREMKDSGIEWIGEIPIDWKIVKLKYLPNKEQNSFIDGDWIDSNYISEDGIRYLTTGNIGDGNYKEQGNGYITLETFKLLKCKYAYPNDLVFSRLNAPFGRSCILPNTFDKYVLAVDLVILRTSCNKSFLSYVTQCNGYQKSVEDYASGTTMKRISRSNLSNINFPIPKPIEQQKIANFLDKKCSQIDSLRADIEKQIEILEEYKKSVITEAVTKGLDPNIEMKDSGIEWIGEIPKDWKIVPLKYLVNYNENSLKENTNPLFEFDYIDIGSVTYENGIENYQHYFFKDAPSRARRIVFENDVILSTVRTYLKATAAIPKNAFPIIVSTGFITLSSKKDILPNYLKYIIQYDAFISKVESLSEGVSYPAITSNEIIRIKVLVPTLKKQKLISDFLNKKCFEINSIVTSKKQQLETLDNYKKSLIYEYVTGKKEVPNE